MSVLPEQAVEPRSAIHPYLQAGRYELLRLAREPIYTSCVIGFPVLLFVLFGLGSGTTQFHGYPLPRYLVASYSSFGAMGAALFAVAGGIAHERGHGWLELLRAFPMPAGAYLFAKLLASLCFGVAVLLILLGLGYATTNLQISAAQALDLLLATVASVLLFACMGVALGLLLPANGAPAVLNLVFLPLSLCGGLWIPLESLPKWLQAIAPALPSYYSGRLALHALGYGSGDAIAAVAAMGAYAAAFAMLALWLFRRQELAQ